ncbi:unnamed protein product [Mycena citricolor]|uniref:ER membrane protein complex subunit 1 n=1 Tax=Mycena citricolor TaxID=2018698 RepID=A0AAD2HF74_9AGAR|nr:unnamed protein product [Mycena citricolor]
MLSLLLGLLSCGLSVLALQESDAGVIDWHKPLIGLPLAPPIFHHATVNGTTQSVLIVPTASNVLAALNATDGSVVWRHVFDAADGLATMRVAGDAVAVLSGPGASNLRVFEALTGLLVSEKRVSAPVEGAQSGVDIAFEESSGDSFILNTNSVSRFGTKEWKNAEKLGEAVTTYSQLVHQPDVLYAVGHSNQAFCLYLSSYDPETGAHIEHTYKHLPPRVESFLTAADVVVWVDPVTQSLGFVHLVPTLKNPIRTERQLKWIAVIDVDLGRSGMFVGVLADGAARVLKIKEGGVVESVHVFPANDGSEAMFAGGVNAEGHPYVVRMWESASGATAAEIYSAQLEGSVETSFLVPDYKYGEVVKLGIDGSKLVIGTTTGAIQLWDAGQLVWAREDGLSGIDVAAFVELPLPERIARADSGESFFSRLQRQITDAKDFPHYLAAFAQRFVTGTQEEIVVSAANGALVRDAFGFHQILVAATAHGSVFGLDSASGKILWSRVFGLGWAGAGVGGTVRPLKIYLVEGEAESKAVIIIAQRKAANGLVDTVLFKIDPLTGASMIDAEQDTDRLLEGTDVISGPLTEAFRLPNSDIIMLIDDYFQIIPYPNTAKSSAAIAKLAPKLYMPFIEKFSDGPRVVGHSLKLDPNMSDNYLAFRTWGLALPRTETLAGLVRPHVGPVASLGKVLGNRTTLYKYLNPRMFVVLTQDNAADEAAGCGLRVVDGAKGSVVYEAVLPRGEGGLCDVRATLVENWLVYHYYDAQVVAQGDTKGWRVVTVELYEGLLDEKTQSSDMSAFSADVMKVEPLEQAYVFFHGISAIGTTSTKFGITSKDIIVATHNHKIQAIPRRLLNPRRPKNRAPTAEEQQEEQLIPYDVLLPEDPRRTISHNYDVAGIRHIISAPALLESTSLVFAYGLDLFLTRVAPSSTFDILSESFNKVQLVLTVFGLGVGIAIAKPMMRRKMLREKWYQK